MITPQEARAKRLKYDLELLESIRCPAIEWSAQGSPPKRIMVTYKICSIVGIRRDGTPAYRHRHGVVIEIPQGYPTAPPLPRMQDGYSPVFHPNVWSNGVICTDAPNWKPTDTLAIMCLQIAKIFQFDPSVTNLNSIANLNAAAWYQENLGKGLFPTDLQTLPIPSVKEEKEDEFIILRVVKGEQLQV